MPRRALLIALALSLALHALIGWRLLPALGWGPLATSLATAYLFLSALLTPAPLMLRLSNFSEQVGDVLAWVGYLAMGLFSMLLVLCLLRDAVLLPITIWEFARPGTWNLPGLRALSADVVMVLALSVSGLGLINARRLAKVVNVDVPITGLPQALSGFTIVQLSDIHVGPTIKRGFLDAVVRRVNELDADLVAITGDVIDGPVSRLREHVAPLAALRSRHGTFVVTGNHEYYHGAEQWIREWKRMGLRVLMNEGDLLRHDGASLLVAGVTDFSAGHFGDAHRSDAQAAARNGADGAAKILLAHQPRSAAAAAAAGFDLQISGHTHGGQYWPWNLFVPLQQPYVSGLNRLKDLWIYVSRGTGYWGPPLRFGAPSEITRLRLVSA